MDCDDFLCCNPLLNHPLLAFSLSGTSRIPPMLTRYNQNQRRTLMRLQFRSQAPQCEKKRARVVWSDVGGRLLVNDRLREGRGTVAATSVIFEIYTSPKVQKQTLLYTHAHTHTHAAHIHARTHTSGTVRHLRLRRMAVNNCCQGCRQDESGQI